MEVESVPFCTSCGSSQNRKIASVGDFGLCQCQECSLLYVNPRPTLAELSRIYSLEYFEGSGEHGNPDGYLEQSSGFRARSAFMVDWVKRLSGIRAGRWLDVGCGPGFLVEAAARAGFRASGVDISEDAVRFGREKLGLDLRVCLAESLGEAGECAPDVITLLDCLFHVREPQLVLAQAFSALREGGVIFAGPFDLHPKGWTPPSLVHDLSSLGIPEHLSFVNQRSMEICLSRLGFEKVQFLPMPQSPGAVVASRLGWLPTWVVRMLRWLVRRVRFVQSLLHRASAAQVNTHAGYVLAHKPRQS